MLEANSIRSQIDEDEKTLNSSGLTGVLPLGEQLRAVELFMRESIDNLENNDGEDTDCSGSISEGKPGRTDQTNLFYRDISAYPLLSADEELQLATKVRAEVQQYGRREIIVKQQGAVQSDNVAARNQLVLANLRLAASIVSRHKGKGVPLEDLNQDAVLAVVRAVDKFDSDKAKFSTYATKWINSFIGEAVENNRNIHLPAHIIEGLARLNKVTQQYVIIHGEDPSLDTLRQLYNDGYKGKAPFNTIIDVIESSVAARQLSLDTSIHPTHDQSLGEAIPDETVCVEDEVITRVLMDDVYELVYSDLLTTLERDVLICKYEMNGKRFVSYTALARNHHVDVETVIQAEESALGKLQKALTGKEELQAT